MGAVGASLLATAVAAAVPPGRSDSTANVSQELISRTAGGGLPNAPASQATISWDGRMARYVAFTSAATNITAGTDGRRNVFLVTRAGGSSGSSWTIGSTTLASRGVNGPANGDSFSPALGGWSRGNSAKQAKCLAFVSQASNLVAGDSNNGADVFVRSLPSGATKRLAAPGGESASDVAVSGDCRTIAVVAGGTLYVKRGGGGLKKLASGASSPRLTYNGTGLSYAKRGRIYVRGRTGHARKIASGSKPAPDAGKPGVPRGRIRSVAYERGGFVYYKDVGGKNPRVSAGSAGQPSAGGGQVTFASGPYVYLYAKSNNFGKKAPQGFCPPGQGDVTATYPSGRANYIVFSCSAGGAYLSFVGGA